MIPLTIRTLRDRSRSVLIWSLAVGLSGAFFMLVWPSVDDSIGGALDAYPEGLKEAFGIVSLASVEEYLNAEMFSLILPLALGIFAAREIAGSVNGAQEHGHLDVLLAHPISRRDVLAAALLAVAIELATIVAAAWLLTVLGGWIAAADFSAAKVAAGYANVWPLALLTAGTAVLVTGFAQRAGEVSGIASGLLVAMYLVDLVGRLADSLDAIRYVSAFRYYGAASIDGIDPLAFAGLTAFSLLLGWLGSLLFQRRDIAG